MHSDIYFSSHLASLLKFIYLKSIRFTNFQLEQEILNFSEGLRVLGLKPEEKLAIFADNSCRWLVADQGIMATGAINVVRGSRSSVEELLQIYSHSESVAMVVDDPVLYNQILETFHARATIRFVILLWGEKSSIKDVAAAEIPIYSYNEITSMGHESHTALLHSEDARKQYIYETISSDDVATLVYTSGTTGNPKGVMLTHENLLHQIKNLWDIVPAMPGDRFLSLLPPWHAYERACEYFIFTHGIEQVYTTIKNLKEDLQRYQPHYLISVPLVYETLYRGIQKQFSMSSAVRKLVALLFLRISLAYMESKRIYEGKCLTKNPEQPFFLVSLDWLWARIAAAILFPLHMLAKKIVYSKIHSAIGISKAGISGGSSLPFHVDKFFEAIEIKVQNGYGLTESSPVVAARQPNCNVLGSIGHPLKHTEIKVVDAETNKDLPYGSKGIVKARGPQVMKGYYKNPLATKQAIDESGWLNTGVIVLEGRAKDTIVLSTGENVEPEEIEEAALRSSLVQQIVVIGQDQRLLFYDEMVSVGLKPNEVTCGHVGLVNKGHQLFKSMVEEYGLNPSLQHYTCLLDLYIRSGHLEEAENILNSMSFKPGEAICASLLSSSRRVGKSEMGVRVANHLLELGP
ncbi:unnamed protein product [Fraxinus pennsylvanica]|uniref:AMP-dependent synthetase/ligase domain-containing protein n=1 Tax=Fraxinus pennsylvanica TaxID=56036 RepID=A0AAD1ZJV9_9LAMI|nr:unnamed protein product [Fraxinus pennsylvanica]